MVAPRAGAWIEIYIRDVRIPEEGSPLVQGRGLKYEFDAQCEDLPGSPLVQGRGLKFVTAFIFNYKSDCRPSCRGVD